jgi:8-hydroxy-5-deazaflavin:NADPH oxidoreductase
MEPLLLGGDRGRQDFTIPFDKGTRMQIVGFIGSGEMGASIARLAVDVGLDVVLSNSRGPEYLTELVASLGERASAATPTETAEAADVVVLSVPLFALDALPVAALAGKVVIDATNYYPDRDGRIAELDDDELTASELVQQHLTGALVVKAFNTIGATHAYAAARPTGASDRSALPIASDDETAKHTVAQLLDRLGYDAIDTGPLADSWRCEPNTPVYITPFLGPLREDGDLTVDEIYRLMHEPPGATVDGRQVVQLVASAVRGPAGGQVPSGVAS